MIIRYFCIWVYTRGINTSQGGTIFKLGPFGAFLPEKRNFRTEFSKISKFKMSSMFSMLFQMFWYIFFKNWSDSSPIGRFIREATNWPLEAKFVRPLRPSHRLIVKAANGQNRKKKVGYKKRPKQQMTKSQIKTS